MTDDVRLDQHLGAVAHATLHRHVAAVDLDAELARLRARLGDAHVVPLAARRQGRWRAAVAVAAVAVAALVAVALVRRHPDQHSIAPTPSITASATPPPTAAPTSTDTPTSTTPATTTLTTIAPTTAPAALRATADPAVVDAGAAVTITPGGVVQRACGDIVTIRSADGVQVIGQLDRLAWRPAPSDGTPVTYPACAGTVSPAAVRMVVPADLATGRYTFCLDATTSSGSCAPVTVTAAPPTTAPAGGPAELDRSIFAVRADTGATLVVDEVAPDGSRTRQVAEADDVSQRRPRSSVLPDGSVVALRDQLDFPRCTNDPIMRTVDRTVVEAPPQLGFARSVTATSQGLIVATRDVCPEGTTWGDPGTHWELVSLDLTDPAARVNVLQTRLPDPSLVWYDQGGVVVTGGEPRIVSASPDGSRVGFIDVFNPDDARWLFVDLAAPASMASLPSSCPLPGDTATEPRFVGNLVVVGRLCATLAPADEPYSTIGQGSGILRVEAIDLTDGVVVWSSAAAGVGPNSYSRTAFVSADLADDGSLWVLLGAAGGVEQPTRSFVLHGDDVTEITRDDYVAFAFDPAELVVG